MHLQLKNIPFELKELSDDGDFVGLASTYGNIDGGNDVVEPGAFDKTIAERGGKVRLMDNHRVRIGVATVKSVREGLEAVGKINTDKQSGKEALSDLKFYRDNGQPLGMSIGYETIDSDPPSKTKDGARHLKQVRLWEVTITEFPMNEQAVVTSVKSFRDLITSIKARRKESKDDFTSELESIQLYASVYQMMSALSSSLSSIRYDTEITDKVAASKESIQAFQAAYLEILPDYLDLMSDSMGWMSRPGFEEKAGRVLSQANRDLIGRCVKDLQSLLDSTNDESSSEEEKSGTPTGAAEKSELEDLHSAEVKLVSDMRSLIPT